MISRILLSFLLATTFFLAGCGETPVVEVPIPSDYALPEIMVKTPTTGSDGYSWNISEQAELILKKEGKSVILEEGETFYTAGTEWEFNGFEGNFVILTPIKSVNPVKPTKPVPEEDPIYKQMRQLD